MKSYFIVLSFAGALALAACETPKSFAPTGGSRADGIVELSYKYGEFQTPIVDDSNTLETARKHCMAWGYQDAQPFGDQMRKCNEGCTVYTVTKRYQCTGSPR